MTASTDVVYVPVGGSNTVELNLAGPDISGRPVTALVDSNQIAGSLNATATQGYTDASGRFVSTLTASSLDAEPGDFATVYYFGSCAATIVRLVVGNEPVTPCGGCRQRIREFSNNETMIISRGIKGEPLIKSLHELLPFSFGPDHLETKNGA